MAAHLVHIGEDDCHRLPVLQRAGYSVSQCASVLQFRAAVNASPEVGAILVSDTVLDGGTEVLAMARALTPAPLILFQNPTRTWVPRTFDLVIDTLMPPGEWLRELDSVIDRSREMQEETARLIVESVQLRQESADVRESSRQERARARRGREPLPEASWGDAGDAHQKDE